MALLPLLPGWREVSRGDLQTLYKHEHDSPVHCFRARCILDAPAEVKPISFMTIGHIGNGLAISPYLSTLRLTN
jgi:hypothetical protein